MVKYYHLAGMILRECRLSRSGRIQLPGFSRLMEKISYLKSVGFHQRDPGSPSETGIGTEILCVSEVIGHPNHHLSSVQNPFNYTG